MIKIILLIVVFGINIFAAGYNFSDQKSYGMSRTEKLILLFTTMIYILLAVEIAVGLFVLEFLKFAWRYINYVTHISAIVKTKLGKFDFSKDQDDERKVNLIRIAKHYARCKYAGLKPDLSARHELYFISMVANNNNIQLPEVLGGCKECHKEVFTTNECSEGTGVYRCDDCGTSQFKDDFVKLVVNKNGRLVHESELDNVTVFDKKVTYETEQN